MNQLQALRQGSAPLPLTEGQAAAQAYRLRSKHHLPYTVLARVMGEYHGSWHGSTYWQKHCRRLGAPASRPGQLTPQERRRLAT